MALPLLLNDPKELETILVTNNEFDFRDKRREQIQAYCETT
jgi:hypothetical protein